MLCFILCLFETLNVVFYFVFIWDFECCVVKYLFEILNVVLLYYDNLIEEFASKNAKRSNFLGVRLC